MFGGQPPGRAPDHFQRDPATQIDPGLDRPTSIKDYYENWIQRKQDYIDNGYDENLVTTDDLNGASEEIIAKLCRIS